jgi:hypothetical protein
MYEIRMTMQDEFIENLILQRTAAFTRLGGSSPLNEWFQTGDKSRLSFFLKENNFLETFLEETIAEMATEVDSLVSKLSNRRVDDLVSIGPGNGIYELLLMKKLDCSRILLIDIEETNDHNHGFNATGSGYASLRATKEFLISNGIDENKVNLCNPHKEALPKFNFDLLISILSMGFHYPCDEYVDFITENMKLEGLVVLDKRRGTPDAGFSKLQSLLTMANVFEYKKHNQCFLEKHKV